jgi:hypothetical protein
MLYLGRLSIALAVVAVVGARDLESAYAQQSTRLDLAIAAGPTPYDLSGTGTALGAGIRAPWQVQTWLIIEPGVGFLSYESQFVDQTSYLFPELSVQGQFRLGRARPFLGGGAGGAFVVQGEGQTVETLHAVVGSRIDVSPDWVISGEVRVRAVQPWSGNTADFLVGLSRRLN